MLAGLAEVAERSQTAITVIPIASARGQSDDAVQRSVQAVQQAVVDGILIYCVDTDHPAREVLRRRDLPIVTNFDLGDPTHGVAIIDEVAAAEPAGALIRELGHRRVAILAETMSSGRAAPEVVPAERVAEQFNVLELQRIAGMARGLGDGVDITIVASGGNSEALAHAATGLVLDREPRPTAILALSDVQAIGALRAIRERGLEPGRDVSVTGFDDIPEAATAGLTTVHQPIRERGVVLGRMLLEPEFTERRVVLPTDLVVRTSTGPAPE